MADRKASYVGMVKTAVGRDGIDTDAGLDAPTSGLSSAWFYWLAALICILALAAFFHEFLSSGFNLIDGNVGDNRFIIAILEHWRAVAQGKAMFRSPNFFWPQPGVLGYSESMVLFFPPYAIGRGAGLDPYLAFELSLILFKAVGFFSMLWLLRSFLAVAKTVAVVGSVIFTLSNLYFIAAAYGHLMTVNFVPLLACLACAAWKGTKLGRKATAYIYASLFGLLLALVLFTSFYIGWFAIFAGFLTILSVVVIRVLSFRSTRPLLEIGHATASKAPFIIAAVLVFSVAIVPFFMTYLPTLRQTGGRSFDETLLHTAQPIDLINIGQTNWMWGRSLETLLVWFGGKPMVLSETQRGWPPFTLFVCLGGAVVAAGGLLGYGGRDHTNRRQPGWTQASQTYLVAALGLSFFVGWLMSIKWHDASLWWLAFKVIPGGAAIRVPVRFNLILNILVVVVVSLLLNAVRIRSQSVFWLAAMLLIAEQINTLPFHTIDRYSENALLSRPRALPSGCRSFFVDIPATPERPWYANQIDAMLIARMNNLPTLDGYSGWFPPDWQLYFVEKIENVRSWVLDHHIAGGVCGLNLRDGDWTRFDFKMMPYLPGSTLDFRRGGNAGLYKAQGWGEAEDGGSWNLGRQSVLLLNLPEIPDTDMLLSFKAHSFLSPKRPNFREQLLINGSNVYEWTVSAVQIEKQVALPRKVLHSRLLKIVFVDEDPKSPAELGNSSDGRMLGLALESLQIAPVK